MDLCEGEADDAVGALAVLQDEAAWLTRSASGRLSSVSSLSAVSTRSVSFMMARSPCLLEVAMATSAGARPQVAAQRRNGRA